MTGVKVQMVVDLGYNGNMLKNQTTPDGYYVDAEGLWDGMSPAE